MGEKINGFKRLDIEQYGDVDFVQNAKDLSNFEEGSVEEIYASHILEHFTTPELPGVVSGWYRVLKENGVLWLSVPDFDSIVSMYLRTGRQMSTWINNLIHGDQDAPSHYHYQAFTYPVVSGRLSDAGFRIIERVNVLPYALKDASRITDNIFHIPISINIKAIK
jgi:predicted SAM-dependent methyltransferase